MYGFIVANVSVKASKNFQLAEPTISLQENYQIQQFTSSKLLKSQSIHSIT